MGSLDARIGFIMSALLVLSLGLAVIVAGLVNASSGSGSTSINRTAAAIDRYEDMRAPDGHSIVFIVVQPDD